MGKRGRFWPLVGLLVALAAGAMSGRAAEPAYRLGPDDALRITVFGEGDLSGEFTVDGAGRVALPLIGPVMVDSLTTAEAEALIRARFADGYLKDPRVSVEVTNYRPFYILGEVQEPGAYPYANGLTVRGAVALGGGFTYRADEDDIEIKRKGEAPVDVGVDGPVLPGDVIDVGQRFF